jgi:predicted  nucleic acid-binding Zn-ribbon protein
MMDECYEDENEVWSEASKIADERDAAKREVAQLKQRVADLKFAMGDTANWFDRAMAAERERDALRDEVTSLKARLAGPLLKPCPTCHGDAVSCGAPGCPTCADSPVDGWVPA